MSTPRLILNYATPDLERFEEVARAAAALSARYDVRLVVSHMARKDTRQLIDPGDPYLEYSAILPDLFRFAPPDAVAPFVDRSLVAANVELARDKLAVLRRYGLQGAFLGREPVYLPEAFYGEYPHLRGPRVDHPRRSRNPCFALCLHHPEAQALYRAAAEGVIAHLPDVDTFYWWTNDSGAGFCWYEGLYPGANGPQRCRELGPVPALAAFHTAVLDGARAQGVAEPISAMTHTRTWDAARQPAGAYRYPAEDSAPGVRSIPADTSLTYPVGCLWDPLERLEQIRALGEDPPVATVWWLSDVYHRAAMDPASTRLQIALWATAAASPDRNEHITGRVALLSDLAADAFGESAAGDAVDGWVRLHEAFGLQRHNPLRGPSRFLPLYGPVSHRWLTRPMVAFPEELTPEEEGYFLPHVFAVGEDARRTNVLDLHGYPTADAREAYDLRSTYYDQIAAALRAAATSFDGAARKAEAGCGEGLASAARAARLLACLWQTCRNWIEYAVLRTQGEARTVEEVVRLSAGDRSRAEAYRQRLDRVLRAELDNTLAFQDLLGLDPEGIVTRAVAPEDEDTFTLAPNLLQQLSRKREIMRAHWQDTARLVPLPDR
jgi:hypothetical protein